MALKDEMQSLRLVHERREEARCREWIRRSSSTFYVSDLVSGDDAIFSATGVSAVSY